MGGGRQDLTLKGFAATTLADDYFAGYFTVFSLKLLDFGLETLSAATLQRMPFLQALCVGDGSGIFRQPNDDN